MKLIIAATAALALLATPVLAHGHHNHASKTHDGSGDSKGDKKEKGDKGDKDSKGDDSNPFSSLLKNFSKLKPHD